MIQRERRAARLHAREGTQRNLRTGGGVHVNIFQRIGILLELRIDFHHHVILIELREDGGDLALAEGVVQRVVDIRGQHAEARGGVAIDGQRGEQPLVLLIAGDVANFRNGLQLFDEARSPVRQFFRVHVFQAVLKLRAADAVFDGEVLHRLHEQRHAVDFRDLWLQAANHIAGVEVALVERLQIDLDAPAVERGVGAVDADEGRQTLHRGIFQNNVGERQLPSLHGGNETSCGPSETPRITPVSCTGKKPFGNVDVQQNGGDQRGDGDQQRNFAILQNGFQRAAVAAITALKASSDLR